MASRSNGQRTLTGNQCSGSRYTRVTLNDQSRKACEARINEFPQFTTTIEEMTIHFTALFSEREDAVPILLLHGWPGNAALSRC